METPEKIIAGIDDPVDHLAISPEEEMNCRKAGGVVDYSVGGGETRDVASVIVPG